MASELEVTTLYENDHLEKFKILPDNIMTYETIPGELTIGQRKNYVSYVQLIHTLMIQATIKKIEFEEKTI
jgi:hypothetical protein